ncbi:MAG TPA: ABC transporter ATP-binding protein [Pseudonocardiaceae bacterium]
MTDAVRVTDVRRAYGDHQVLAGVDLAIGRGEFVALLGRSGSGKSTLLRAVAGLDPDYQGSVLVPRSRAVVFQDPRLQPWLRVLGNVLLGLPRARSRESGRRALAEVELTGHERAWPVTLSGGEAQRVALARALVREPDLLLLDEPFGALDALTRIRMHDLLRTLCARHRPAVLLVTHDVDEAIVLADRIVVLGTDGRLGNDTVIDLPRPRRLDTQEFGALRTGLLAALGVIEAV